MFLLQLFSSCLDYASGSAERAADTLLIRLVLLQPLMDLVPALVGAQLIGRA